MMTVFLNIASVLRKASTYVRKYRRSIEMTLSTQKISREHKGSEEGADVCGALRASKGGTQIGPYVRPKRRRMGFNGTKTLWKGLLGTTNPSA